MVATRSETAAASLALAGLLALLVTDGCQRNRLAPGQSATARAAASDSSVAPVQTTRGTQIALLYSSNLQGEYEHCGCPSHPLGGLVRRATLIDRARAESNGVLVVDAGDLLLPPPPPSSHADGLQDPDPVEVDRRARLMLDAYARMGVQAFLPAEGDLAGGPARLKRLLKAARVPVVASNYFDPTGRPVFDRDRLVTTAGVPIGIFGVVQAMDGDAVRWAAWRIRVADPTLTARDEVASLRARGAKMIVALLHLRTIEAARQLLKDVPGITWAVQGHSDAQLEIPDTIGDARLVEAMSLGKLAGRLDIHVVDGGMTFSDKGQRTQVLAIIDDHRRQLADLERRAAEDKTEQLREFYKLRREGISAAIARETALARTLPPVVRGSWYENQIIPLDESIPDHPAIAQLVAVYNADNARRAAAGLPVGIARRDPRAPAPAPEQAPSSPSPGSAKSASPTTTYAGSAACAGCHEPAWRAFLLTKHAHAMEALVRSRRDADPTCVGCHTTGFLMPGGTASIPEAVSRLKDVGCESCHGPGLQHVTSPNKKDTTTRRVAATVCLGCHTPDRTNGEWNADRFRRAILGPGHGA